MQIVALWEDGLPFLDTAAQSQDALRAMLPNEIIDFVPGDALDNALTPDSILLTLHGSAFPKAAWPVVSAFLRRGGRWLHLGGSPFTRPCRRNADGTWYAETPTTAYSKELFINQSFPIGLDKAASWEWRGALANESFAPLPASRSWALQVRFTDTRDFPDEHGTSGTRDAVLETQCYTLDAEKHRIAAPIIVIDRLHGDFAGATWGLVNAELTALPDANLLQTLVDRVGRGPLELSVRPAFACYHSGERPEFTCRLKSHRRTGDAILRVQVTPDGGDPAQATEWAVEVTLRALPQFISIPVHFAAKFSSGLHRVEATLTAADSDELLATAENGFWVAAPSALAGASPLSVNRDYFERDGEPYPVAGTTYMAGDVHRKFLFEPNAAVWERDFAAMKAAGVNMVRTGLWTAYRRAMVEPGDVDEGVLRAFEAFLLTARKHDIPVTFTFFAFLPEAWSGTNPYLDPRAVSAQQEFVAAFAHRFRHVNDVTWDFINEPSFSSPARVWRTRPNYDAHERTAWAAWLKERESDFSEVEKQAVNPDDVWRERWRLTPNAPLDLPTLADFEDKNIFQNTHPLRVMDYRLFAQAMFVRWTQTLADTVRANGNPHQLITVGQDEGGAFERPNPHFYAPAVDFTTNHSWWLNDDLLWDSVMTKTPDKPNLIQETGVMFAEDVDGSARRSLTTCANLLARKLALSLACGGAGAVQWCWNTNVYMDDDNEVGIGFLHADGSEKPELNVFRQFARFVWENRQKFTGRQLEEVVIVIPHSNMFSVRDTATRATKRAVRTLEYSFGVPTRTVSEYKIEQIGDPKLIVLPSARVLTPDCWNALLTKVHAGATLLVTGYVDADPYRRPDFILKSLGLDLHSAPVSQIEKVFWEDDEDCNISIHFMGEAPLRLEKAVSNKNSVMTVETLQHGAGKIIFCPVPLELKEHSFELNIIDVVVIRAASESFELQDTEGVMVRRVELADTTLYLLLNEVGNEVLDSQRFLYAIFREKTEARWLLEPGQAALVFKARDTGETSYCVLGFT